MGENVYVGGYGYRDKEVHQLVEEMKREDRCEVVKMFTGNDGYLTYTYTELKCPMGTLKKYGDKKYVSEYSHYEMERAFKRAGRTYGR